jgi:hypothetical protein
MNASAFKVIKGLVGCQNNRDERMPGNQGIFLDDRFPENAHFTRALK